MSNAYAAPRRGIGSGPSWLWYLLAVGVFLAGFVGMGVVVFNSLSRLGDDLVQIVVPGERELSLEAGSHTIFHESQSTVDGRIFSADNVAGLGVRLTSAAGEPVTLSQATAGTYQFGGRRGSAVLQFDIAEPGVYLLSGAYRDGMSGPETVLAVGQGFVGGLVVTILSALAFAFGGAGLAVAIGLTVHGKRRKAREASSATGRVA